MAWRFRGTWSERWHARIELAPDGCWEWIGAKSRAGYGQIDIRGRRLYTHRVSYEMAHGPIPVGLEVDHLCNNRACLRPDHLRACTHRENMARSHPGLFNAMKTNCPQGHSYSPENTYVYHGRRNCRMCAKASHIARRERMMAR